MLVLQGMAHRMEDAVTSRDLINVDLVYIRRLHVLVPDIDRHAHLLFHQQFEWVLVDIAHQIRGPDLQAHPEGDLLDFGEELVGVVPGLDRLLVQLFSFRKIDIPERDLWLLLGRGRKFGFRQSLFEGLGFGLLAFCQRRT